MSLISQFVTHFWSGRLWGVGYRIVGSIFSLLSELKSQKGGNACEMVQDAECRVSSSGTRTMSTHTSWTCVPHISCNTYHRV